MALKQYLLIPGPTPVPPEVLSALSHPMINHRSSDFKAVLSEVTEGLKWAYQTKNDVLILTASGTGAMEAALVNTLSPGDRIIIANIGAFGSRFMKIAKAYGLNVDEIKVERGKAVDPKDIDAKLKADKNKDIKAVVFQQNETSTGVINDVKSIAAVVKDHGALTIVDAVSGLLTADLKTDEWGLDVVAAGSQKAFMVPPGLSFVSMSERAWKAYEASKMPRFYFDLGAAKKFAATGETPWTPCLTIAFGMQVSLRMLKAEGLENIFSRHDKLSKAVRAGVKALGFGLLTEDICASKAVTPVVPPAGIDAEALRKAVREQFGVVLAGGQEDLKGKIFRIGHLGYIDKMDMVTAFSALEIVGSQMGAKIKMGSAVAAVEEMLR
jgi:aspartate aminotransferase-like enzyme